MAFETVYWKEGRVVLIDQKRLPGEVVYHAYDDPEDVARAIETMIVRGAPAIGVAAALGLALASTKMLHLKLSEAREHFASYAQRFSKTRPTAVNLFWAIERMKAVGSGEFSHTESWSRSLVDEALAIREADIQACKDMGELGEKLLPEKARVLTHCNAGALCAAGWGTALGVIRSAVKNGKSISVFADETRPFLQGARLTAWELHEDGIPVTILTDNMAGHLMARGEIDAVIVGADRIAANGDAANKIGTYTLAILAKEHGIPFYIAAPLSTIDRSCPNGDAIPIEERDPEEVFEFAGKRIAPLGVSARHPAFDVTPARFIHAIVTEKGVAKAPYSDSLAALFTS